MSRGVASVEHLSVLDLYKSAGEKPLRGLNSRGRQEHNGPNHRNWMMIDQVAKNAPKHGIDARELVSINPATGAELGRVPMTTEEDVGEAARQARRAQSAWGSLRFKERAAVVLRAKDRL